MGGVKIMIYFKNEFNEVLAYSSYEEMRKFNKASLTKITEGEALELITPPPKTIEEVRAEVEVSRKREYANPLTGSDPLFSEAYRMQLMGEVGWELVRDKAIARYQEIQAEYPWPME